MAQVAPSAPPSTEASTGPATTHPSTFAFRFQDTPTLTVLDYLSKSAGLTIIASVPITGRVTILNQDLVSTDTAIDRLNSVLKDQGIGGLRMGDTLKIESLDTLKKDSNPVRSGADPDLIHDSDEIITQIIPVATVDAVKLAKELAPLIDTSRDDVTSDSGSNTLMVTSTSARIRRLVKIVHLIDQSHSAESDIVVRQLKFADSAAAVKLIQDIFAPPTQNTGTTALPGGFNFGGFGRGGRGGGGGGNPFGGIGGAAGAAGADDKGDTGHVTASADARTNTIVVAGSKATLQLIKTVLDELDTNAAPDQTFFTYQVKHGQSVGHGSYPQQSLRWQRHRRRRRQWRLPAERAPA